LITLSGNKITTLNSSDLFRNNQKLQIIDLSSNQITVFDKNLFRNLSLVLVKDSAWNNFTTIDFNILHGSSTIIRFCLYSLVFSKNVKINVTGLLNLTASEILSENCKAGI
jgi:hypothetical protein